MAPRAGLRPLSLRTLGLRPLVVALAVTVLLAGCGTWWQLQQQALQRRLAVERCRQKRASIDQVLDQAKVEQQAVDRLAAEVYRPTAAPPAPDPELANRYSQLDRQLDEERYTQQREAWQASETLRRQRWQRSWQQRRQRAKQRLAVHIADLRTIDAKLVRNGRLDAAAIAQARRCPTP